MAPSETIIGYKSCSNRPRQRLQIWGAQTNWSHIKPGKRISVHGHPITNRAMFLIKPAQIQLTIAKQIDSRKLKFASLLHPADPRRLKAEIGRYLPRRRVLLAPNSAFLHAPATAPDALHRIPGG
jgi:hypothetical protein